MNRTALSFVAGVLLATGVVHANVNADANAATPQDRVEKQPHMRASLAALRTAREQLQKASADKGGHRQKAIDLVNAAIDEVQAGIDADNANGKDH